MLHVQQVYNDANFMGYISTKIILLVVSLELQDFHLGRYLNIHLLFGRVRKIAESDYFSFDSLFVRLHVTTELTRY